jgi:DMSO/TMAO reductase YedYZ molybdopterin-dependent catalytic subunit
MRFRLVSLLSVLFLPLLLLLFTANAAQSQRESFSLVVNGEVEKPLQLSLSELSKLPRRTVQAKNHDGKDCSYEGVELREILLRAGVPFGKELKGKWRPPLSWWKPRTSIR